MQELRPAHILVGIQTLQSSAPDADTLAITYTAS
jgi:hypothetical protein